VSELVAQEADSQSQRAEETLWRRGGEEGRTKCTHASSIWLLVTEVAMVSSEWALEVLVLEEQAGEW